MAPIGVAAAAAIAASGVLSAHATVRHLPKTNPTTLLAEVQTSQIDGFTGTVVSHLSLGLPQLPALSNADSGVSMMSLLSGSHTMQIWYGGLTKQRVALLGATDETDVFRDGRQFWEWNSADRTAVHSVLPAHAATATLPSNAASLTPDQLARQVLDKLDPTTEVQVKSHAAVADRSAYDLVLTPRTPTRIGSVHIAVDGQTKMPLAVQVYRRGAAQPAIDVAFTSIRYGAPAQRNFAFTPPPDAKVHTVRHAKHSATADTHPSAAPAHVHVVGSGWTRVLAAQLPTATARKLDNSSALQMLTPVSGSWGKGRLLDSSLVTVLITSDGRVFTGAVEPSVLYSAAGAK